MRDRSGAAISLLELGMDALVALAGPARGATSHGKMGDPNGI